MSTKPKTRWNTSRNASVRFAMTVRRARERERSAEATLLCLFRHHSAVHRWHRQIHPTIDQRPAHQFHCLSNPVRQHLVEDQQTGSSVRLRRWTWWATSPFDCRMIASLPADDMVWFVFQVLRSNENEFNQTERQDILERMTQIFSYALEPFSILLNQIWIDYFGRRDAKNDPSRSRKFF